MRHTTIASLAVAAGLLGGCGGASDAGGLHDGVYQFELTEEHLLEKGMPARQARTESGTHEITLERGSFIDRWRAQDGRLGSCWGTFVADGNRMTFRWTSGCTGDWAMSYSIDGDVVTWSDFEPLDPNAGAEEQNVTEVFNSVPWTDLGDAPNKGEN